LGDESALVQSARNELDELLARNPQVLDQMLQDSKRKREAAATNEKQDPVARGDRR